ncbi:MAG: CAP domain-containing protein [Gemmataceae bacterium]
MIRFQCPHCKTVLQSMISMAGAVVTCGKCQARLRVPNEQATSLAPLPAPPPTRSRYFWPVLVGVFLVSFIGTAAVSLLLPPWKKAAEPVAEVPQDNLEPKDSESKSAEPNPSEPKTSEPKLPSEKPTSPTQLRTEPTEAPNEPPQPVLPVPPTKPVEPTPAPPAVTTIRTLPREESLTPTVVAVVPKDKEPTTPKSPGGPDTPKDKEPPAIANKSRLERAINRLNDARAAAKAPALSLDPWACQRATEHAQALLKQSDEPVLDPKKPANAILWKAPLSAMLDWLEAPLHRDLLLLPARKTLGIGTASDEKGRTVTVIEGLFDSQVSLGTVPAVVYPAGGQTEVPLQFSGNEVPDPLPELTDKQVGYPITVQFPANHRVSKAQLLLEGPDGRAVETYLSTPEKPANPEYPSYQQNTVCAFAVKPLLPSSRYVVRVRAYVDGKPWARLWAFSTQAGDRSTLTPEQARAVLERIIFFRQAAGLKPVRLEEKLSQPCQEHALYLARNLGRDGATNPLTQNERLPGATEAGAKMARQSMVRVECGPSARDAVDWLAESVLNRNLLLNPSLETVGLGAASRGPRGWMWVIHLPPQRTRGDGQPVLYPGKDQRDVPLAFSRPLRDLVAEAKADQVAGFPITLTFFPTQKLTEVSATLQTADGSEVPIWLSTPQKRLPGTGQYNQIVLLPQEPLKPETRYEAKVQVRVDGSAKTFRWTFSTLAWNNSLAEVANHLVEELNRHRRAAGLAEVTLEEQLSKACQSHADYLARNLTHPAQVGLNIHEQDPKLPGYTQAGHRAGQASVIAVTSEPRESVALWMATLYHRLPLLQPEVKRVGYGQRLHPTRGWITVLDCTSGK